jgi:anti-anti-sigma factor
VVTIFICEKLTFENKKSLLTRIKEADCDNGLTLDFRKTKYIDSAGLGLLLYIRHMLGDRNDIKLINLGIHPKAVIDMANFHRLFDIRAY